MVNERINGNLLKINGQTISTLKNYGIERNKLWKDGNRSMSGILKATLVGIFPKLNLTFRPMNQSEMQALTVLLDKDFFNVEYWDNRTKSTQTARFYAGDYSVILNNKHRGIYEEFSVNLIALERKRYV